MLNFKIQLPCTFNAIKILEESVKPVLAVYVSSFRKMQFVIHELLINSYEATIKKYGEENASRYLISLELRRIDTDLEIAISDHGGGIPFSPFPKPTLDNNLFHDRGRGLLLVEQLVDELNMELDDSGMFSIKLRKEGEFNNGSY